MKYNDYTKQLFQAAPFALYTSGTKFERAHLEKGLLSLAWDEGLFDAKN